MILSYVLRQDMEDDAENKERVFKNEMFGHAYLSRNPELFKDIFPDDIADAPVDDEDLEWIVPDNQLEAASFFNEMKDLFD
jgi:hypothetical protein